MKCVVDTTLLREALTDVKPAVGTQRPFVLLDAGDHLEVRADDLDVGICATLAIEGRSEGGRVLVPHTPLAGFISKADSPEVELVVEDGVLAVQDGNASLALATVADDWFPNRTPVEGDGVPLDAEAWGRVRGMMPFCSTDSAKAPMNGVMFGEADAVATDTYQLAAVTHPFGIDHAVPVSVLKGVPNDAESVTVRAGGNTVEVQAGNVRITTASLSGDMPDWRRVVPENPVASITVSAPALSRAVDRASVLAKDSAARMGKMVRLYRSDGAMVVESVPDSEKGDSRSLITEMIDAEIAGEWDYPFGLFTVPMACLNAILGKPDELTLNLFGAGVPVTVRTEDVFVLMAVVRV